MKVLLCQNVEKLGWLGDIVEVKDGYARNYLLPYKLAIVPTEANIRLLAKEKVKHVDERKLAREQLERASKAVQGAEVVLAAKANEKGNLFGSITEHDIADNLRQQGFEVKDEMVQLDGHIKQTGQHDVTIKFADDLSGQISVVVVSQDETSESKDEDSENSKE